MGDWTKAAIETTLLGPIISAAQDTGAISYRIALQLLSCKHIVDSFSVVRERHPAIELFYGTLLGIKRGV